MNTQNRISIVEPDIFVSQDMCDTFQAALPQAVCTVYPSVEAARAASAPDGLPDLIVVSADRNGEISASEQDVLWLFDRRVIAIDPRIPQPPPGWAHLSKPFTQQQLIDAAALLLQGHRQWPDA